MKKKLLLITLSLTAFPVVYSGYIYSFNFQTENNFLPDYFYTNNYYRGREKNYHSYKKSLELSKWIHTYYSPINDIPSIFSANAPKKYNSQNKQFGYVYAKINARGIYSGCRFYTDENNNYRKFDTKDCTSNYKSDGTKEMNGFEHINPQSILGNGTFSPMLAKADLNNLRPSLLYQFNSPRSNHLFTSFKSPGFKNGVLFKISISEWTNFIACEPRNEVKGDIARITFYMHDIYHLNYDINYYKLLIKWSLLDPVDKYEKYLNKLNGEVMGITNMYIDYPSLIPH